MAKAFRSVRADPLTFLLEVTERFGDLASFPVPGPPALLVNDPADARHVLQTSARHWGKQTVQYAALARVTGPGLLASSEPTWIEHRRVAAPAFHHQRLEAVGAQVRAAADAAITARLGSGEASTAGGGVVDVAALTHGIGLDAVGRALFSADLSGRARELLEATSEAATLVVKAGRSILPGARYAPTPTNLRMRSTRRRLDVICAELIAQRRGAARRAPAAGEHGDDLLGLLLDSGMSDLEIRHELVTMIIAGHETVAAALAWTLMLLAEHPQVQEQVRDELAAHPGPVPMLGHREILPLTRAVVDEALRLYPPAWTLSRRAQRPTWSPAARCPPAPWSSSARGCCTGAPTPFPTRWPSGPSASWPPTPAAPATCPSARARGCASAASSRWARWCWC